MGRIFEFPYRTVAEVNLQALVKNLVSLRASCRKEIIPVVKADAYGHGMIPVSKVLLNRGCCEALAVATLEEAIELRNHFHHRFAVLVLSGFLPHQIDAYYRYNLIPLIHSLSHLKALQGRSRLPQIHVKIDTGMNRLGIKPDQMVEAINLLSKLPDKAFGLATHLADSESLLSPFIDEQLSIFEYWYRELLEKKLLQTDARIHFSNSGAVLRKKTALATAVRPGIGLYGISPNPRLDQQELLAPVLQWRSRVLTVKELSPQETVGYGRTYRAQKQEKIALIPVGYADGYPRILSNRGEALISGVRVPVRGRVSMDLTAIDCTDIDVREGSLVTLIGRDGKENISASELAGWAGTIPYEVLCGISKRVQRIYFDSDAT